MTDTSVAVPTDEASEPALARGVKTERPLSTGRMWLMLLGLIAVGAFLRYWRLGFQSYWTDEGYTIVRIRGTFKEMLDMLTDQGFPPGWYALLRGWCLMFENVTHNGAWAFSPVVTRALPALFGTLTIPAMYLLGRQFTDRRGALLVALFAAINPFFIYYSRDIKMYAALWFFSTLNMALFFQWLSSRRHWRHWLWFPLMVIMGACATAVQSIAWILVGLQLLFVLTRPRIKSLDGPMWLAGVGLMALFPVYWFLEYVQPAKWISRVSGEGNNGTVWYADYTDMTWKTGASLPTSHLLGYLWPVYPPDEKISDWFVLGSDFKTHLATRSIERLAWWEWAGAIFLFAVLIVGLIPWRGLRWKLNAERATSATRGRWWWVALWIAIPSVVLAATWIPKGTWWYTHTWGKIDVKPMWEPRYLGILVPAWILWLAAALRRLPTWPVRVAAIVVVAGMSIASSLTNHLIYRNAPYQRAVDIAEQFVDKNQRATAAIAVPTSYYPAPALNAAFTVARGLRPGSAADLAFIALFENRTTSRSATFLFNVLSTTRDYREASPRDVFTFINNVIGRARVKTIIITDPYGDLVKKDESLSDEYIGRILGPQWTLVHEESYRLYYEWRFYIFSTWRTRVWQLAEPVAKPSTRPAARP